MNDTRNQPAPIEVDESFFLLRMLGTPRHEAIRAAYATVPAETMDFYERRFGVRWGWRLAHIGQGNRKVRV